MENWGFYTRILVMAYHDLQSLTVKAHKLIQTHVNCVTICRWKKNTTEPAVKKSHHLQGSCVEFYFCLSLLWKIPRSQSSRALTQLNLVGRQEEIQIQHQGLPNLKGQMTIIDIPLAKPGIPPGAIYAKKSLIANSHKGTFWAGSNPDFSSGYGMCNAAKWHA